MYLHAIYQKYGFVHFKEAIRVFRIALASHRFIISFLFVVTTMEDGCLEDESALRIGLSKNCQYWL